MEIDLKTITDTTKLESLAYQQLKIINQAQNGLQLIEQRLAEIRTAPPIEDEKAEE